MSMILTVLSKYSFGYLGFQYMIFFFCCPVNFPPPSALLSYLRIVYSIPVIPAHNHNLMPYFKNY